MPLDRDVCDSENVGDLSAISFQSFSVTVDCESVNLHSIEIGTLKRFEKPHELNVIASND